MVRNEEVGEINVNSTGPTPTSEGFTSKTTSSAQTEVCSPIVSACNELLSNAWLSDNTLRNYFSILESKFSLLSKSCYIVNPVISHIVKNITDFEHFLLEEDLGEYNYLIFPINDSQTLNSPSGTHWSVLVLDKPQKKFLYMDSSKSPVLFHAKTVAHKIIDYLELKSQNIEFVHVPFPNQLNGYDCAIYMIYAVESLILDILDGSDLNIELLSALKLNETDLIRKRSCTAYILNNSFLTNKETILTLMKGVEGEHHKTEELEKKILALNKTVKGLSNKLESTKITLQGQKNNMQSAEMFQRANEDKLSTKGLSSSAFQKVNHRTFIKSNIACFNLPVKNRYKSLEIASREEIMPKDSDVTELEEEESKLTNEKCSKQARKSLYDKQHWRTKKQLEHNHISNSQEEPIRVEIYADSQGRGLPEIVASCSKGRVYVDALVKPGADVEYIYNQAIKSTHRPLILIAGTNDIVRKSSQAIYSKLENQLKFFCSSRPVCITTIPPRFDVHPNNKIHFDIAQTNNYLREVASRIDNLNLIDFDDFQRHNFSQHGLHLNQKGKKKLALMIIKFVKNIDTTKPDKTKLSLKYSGKCNTNLSSVSNYSSEEKLKVTDTDMARIIEKYRNDKTVGFAHSISGDLYDPRHMSAGVAVVFKDHFGKPKASQRVSNHLALQNVEDGSPVFNLITKDRFFGKPKGQDYDAAFRDLTTDFKNKGLKHLICSPIGCVHDRVDLKHFAKNIKKFQKSTDATVLIVSYSQKSHRIIRNGLSHEEFLRQLKTLLYAKTIDSDTNPRSRSASSSDLGTTQLDESLSLEENGILNEQERPSTPVAPGDRSYASVVSSQPTPTTSPQSNFVTPQMDSNDRVCAKNSTPYSKIMPT